MRAESDAPVTLRSRTRGRLVSVDGSDVYTTRIVPETMTQATASLASLGYRMPAEWEPHAATWLSWPKRETSWPGKFQEVPPYWARMAKELSEGEAVRILVNDHEMHAVARKILKDHGADSSNIELVEIPTDDSWIRDFGPIFVKRDDAANPLIALDWGFNTWGDKYPPYDLDNRVPQRIAERLGIPVVEGGMILEGGSIDVNGAGLLLTTEQCLLNPNRNPHMTRAQIEERLMQFLGVSKVLWLGDGIVGDDTDGHIDDLTRFVSSNTIVTVVEEDESDENYPMLRENLERLHDLRNLEGGKFEIVELPMPPPVIHEDARLPASYANFYIGNAVVLVPTYNGGKRDQQVLGVLGDLFPGRRIVGIPSADLVWGLGAYHCVSQQQPAV